MKSPRSTSDPQAICPQRCLLFIVLAFAVATLLPLAFGAEEPAANVPAPLDKKGSEEPAANIQAKLDKKGSIVLGEKATLGEWILAIQQEWKVNIVCAGDLQTQTISGGFTNTPLRQVLNSILYSIDCGYEIVGDSLLVQRLDNMGAIKPQFELATIPLEYLSPTEAEPSVRIMLSKSGTVLVIPSSKTLFVTDLPERIAKVREHLMYLEEHARQLAEKEHPPQPQPTAAGAATPQGGAAQPAGPEAPAAAQAAAQEVVEVFTTQFVKAETLMTPVQSVLGVDARVTVPANENKIIVVGSPKLIEMASQIIQRLDVAEPQVLISALLYDVSLETMEKLGVNWNHAVKGRINAAGDPQSVLDHNSSMFSMKDPAAGGDSGSGGDTGGDSGGDAATTAAATTVNSLWTITHLSQHFDLTAYIQALDQTDGARLLARPSVLAYNRSEAQMKVISEIPVQQLTETQQGGSIGTTAFREAGISLKVTPEIMTDGTVKMKVLPEYSLLSGYSLQGQPIIDRRTTDTTVHVTNGQTIVIGGLLRRNELETVTGIPGLMNWKYIGRIFRNHDTTVSDSELLVFIKTEIILPGCATGTPREQIAAAVTEERLEMIPPATNYPIFPACRDPHCPYHCPRPYGAPPAGPCLHYAGPGMPPEPVPAEPLPAAPEPPGPALSAPTPAEAPQPPVGVEEARRRSTSPAGTQLMRRLPSVNDENVRRIPQVAAQPAAPNQVVPLPSPTNSPSPPPPPASREHIGWRFGLGAEDIFRR